MIPMPEVVYLCLQDFIEERAMDIQQDMEDLGLLKPVLEWMLSIRRLERE